ncbi:protein of unknown function DUF554 [Thermodesulfobium narugense DSM 14796]|uniref:DUF554 domain-containing protein n=1 Tax=Thermodesulfobium narugense DSM 14796 TaxID=747365 RepID=M1E797_9BACT|nr:DUF554 domain-containing protein [Thermodesulfobium narugense]AEE14365.1 protein of unknown function DUF554 [Thermodesulfobium narugense DSM 14796]
MTGTIINAFSVIIGSSIGLVMGSRLAEKYKNIVINAISLVTLLIGLKLALEVKSIFWVLLSLILGGLIGEFISLEGLIERFGNYVNKKMQKGDVVNAFMSASLLFCVGPMSILGSFQDGLKGDYSILLLKSALDGVSSLFLASSLGVGVFFSFITILIYQGSLTLFANALSGLFSNTNIASNFYATGGIMLIGIGFNLLSLTKIKTINYIFALILIIIFSKFGGIL